MNRNYYPLSVFRWSTSVLFLAVLLSVNSIHAQISDDTDVKSYFDDGGISERHRIAKFNVGGLVFGESLFSVEQRMSDFISVEGGLGLMLPYRNMWMLEGMLTDGASKSERDLGFAFMLGTKMYWDGYALESYYTAVQFQRNAYAVSSEKTVENLITVLGGYQFYFGERFTADIAAGLHYILFSKSPKTILNENGVPFYKDGYGYTFQAKIGYLF